MAKKRPPLHLLHIFDAAARHSSFKKAGEELHLTASAVSHQIKSLEEYLGIKLFERVTRGVKLTEQGRRYSYELDGAFRQIERATEQLLGEQAQTVLQVNMMPSLATNLVFPHLHEFEALYPEITIEIDATEGNIDLDKAGIDMAVRHGFGDWDDYWVKKLCDSRAVLVCSPQLQQKYNLTAPEQLADVPLIKMTGWEQLWYMWAKQLGLSQFSNRKMLGYESYNTSIQAAVQGVGVATAILELEQKLLDEGKLVALFDLVFPTSRGIYCLLPKSKEPSVEVKAFMSWLKQRLTVINE